MAAGQAASGYEISTETREGFVGYLLGSEEPQFLIDQGQQLIGRLGVALFNRVQDACDVGHGGTQPRTNKNATRPLYMRPRVARLHRKAEKSISVIGEILKLQDARQDKSVRSAPLQANRHVEHARIVLKLRPDEVIVRM